MKTPQWFTILILDLAAAGCGDLTRDPEDAGADARLGHASIADTMSDPNLLILSESSPEMPRQKPGYARGWIFLGLCGGDGAWTTQFRNLPPCNDDGLWAFPFEVRLGSYGWSRWIDRYPEIGSKRIGKVNPFENVVLLDVTMEMVFLDKATWWGYVEYPSAWRRRR